MMFKTRRKEGKDRRQGSETRREIHSYLADMDRRKTTPDRRQKDNDRRGRMLRKININKRAIFQRHLNAQR